MNTRLTELLDRYLDDALGAQERQELIALLRESRSARQEFWKQARFHAALRQFAEESRGGEWAGVVPLASRPEAPSRWGAYWGWGVAAAASLALLLLVWQPWQAARSDTASRVQSSGKPAAPPVAMVARSVGGIWAKGAAPWRTGAELAPGKLPLEAGLVQIDFFSGARVVLEGPAELELLNANQARLNYGKATCEVAAHGRGFRMSAPGMEVLDRGTAFGLKAPREGVPEVHVLEGKVSVWQESTPSAAQRELDAASALRLTPNGFASTSFTPAEFTRTESLRRQEEISARGQQQRWEQAARALDDHPAVLVHYTFGDPQMGQITNQAKAALAGTGGTVIGCRPGEGRWPGKRALEFRGRADRVLLSVPGEHRSLTLMAWLRLDAFTQPLSALLMSETPWRWTRARGKPGEEREVAASAVPFRWELNDGSQVFFNCVTGSDPQARKLQWSTFHSPPTPASERQGQWLCWAVTHDEQTGESVHYLDGRVLARASRPLAHPFYTAQLALGNLSLSQPEVQQGKQYAFYGAMDEFVLACRPMSENEIRAFYEQGKP